MHMHECMILCRCQERYQLAPQWVNLDISAQPSSHSTLPLYHTSIHSYIPSATHLYHSPPPNMTALLPPNLLKLFAPRPPVPYLKPLVKDDAKRGPNKLRGVGELVTRLRTEADEDEIKQGLKDEADLKNGKEDAGTKMELGGEEGELKEKELKAAAATSGVKGKKDPIKQAGVVGQEAVKMRRELRAKRKEEYKKNLEENCRCFGLTGS
jgi:hypothetical protein